MSFPHTYDRDTTNDSTDYLDEERTVDLAKVQTLSRVVLRLFAARACKYCTINTARALAYNLIKALKENGMWGGFGQANQSLDQLMRSMEGLQLRIKSLSVNTEPRPSPLCRHCPYIHNDGDTKLDLNGEAGTIRVNFKVPCFSCVRGRGSTLVNACNHK